MWGLAGGGAASVVTLCLDIRAAQYHWPWSAEGGELAPRMVVLLAGLLMGAVVSAAAHDQISGPWPAFIFGIGAPATIRGILSGVEVTPQPGSRAAAPRARREVPRRLPPVSEEGEVREDAS